MVLQIYRFIEVTTISAILSKRSIVCKKKHNGVSCYRNIISNTDYVYMHIKLCWMSRHRNIPVYVVVMSMPIYTCTFPFPLLFHWCYFTILCGLSMRMYLLSVDFLNKVCTCNTFLNKTGTFQGWESEFRKSEYWFNLNRALGLRCLHDSGVIWILPKKYWCAYKRSQWKYLN